MNMPDTMNAGSSSYMPNMPPRGFITSFHMNTMPPPESMPGYSARAGHALPEQAEQHQRPERCPEASPCEGDYCEYYAVFIQRNHYGYGGYYRQHYARKRHDLLIGGVLLKYALIGVFSKCGRGDEQI